MAIFFAPYLSMAKPGTSTQLTITRYLTSFKPLFLLLHFMGLSPPLIRCQTKVFLCLDTSDCSFLHPGAPRAQEWALVVTSLLDSFLHQSNKINHLISVRPFLSTTWYFPYACVCEWETERFKKASFWNRDQAILTSNTNVGRPSRHPHEWVQERKSMHSHTMEVLPPSPSFLPSFLPFSFVFFSLHFVRFEVKNMMNKETKR